MDRRTVQTEVDESSYVGREHDPAALEALREKIAGEIRRAIGVGVAVELKPPGEFERTEFKARRIIDLRK